MSVTSESTAASNACFDTSSTVLSRASNPGAADPHLFDARPVKNKRIMPVGSPHHNSADTASTWSFKSASEAGERYKFSPPAGRGHAEVQPSFIADTVSTCSFKTALEGEYIEREGLALPAGQDARDATTGLNLLPQPQGLRNRVSNWLSTIRNFFSAPEMLAIEPPPTSSLQSADAMSFGGASEKRPKTHPLRSRAAGGRVAQKGCFQLLRAFFFALCQQAIGAFFKLDCVQRLCHYLLRKMWDQFVSQLIKASNAAHRTEKKG